VGTLCTLGVTGRAAPENKGPNSALARHADQDWYAAATAPEIELNQHTTKADLMADMWDRYPLYFAHSNRPAQGAHVDRLRRDGALDPEIQCAWNTSGYAEKVDLTPLLGRVSCPPCCSSAPTTGCAGRSGP